MDIKIAGRAYRNNSRAERDRRTVLSGVKKRPYADSGKCIGTFYGLW